MPGLRQAAHSENVALRSFQRSQKLLGLFVGRKTADFAIVGIVLGRSRRFEGSPAWSLSQAGLFPSAPSADSFGPIPGAQAP